MVCKLANSISLLCRILLVDYEFNQDDEQNHSKRYTFSMINGGVWKDV